MSILNLLTRCGIGGLQSQTRSSVGCSLAALGNSDKSLFLLIYYD